LEQTDQFRARARVVFQNFRKAFEITDKEITAKGKGFKIAYWRFGCSFDTMTDYLLLLKNSKDTADTKVYTEYANFLKQQLSNPTDWATRIDPYAQYLKAMVRFRTSCCYDDFCWWGIASAKALEGSPYYEMFLELFGEDGTKDFQNTAKAIWEVVNAGNYSPVVETVSPSYPGYEDFKTNFEKRPEYHGGSPSAWERVITDKPVGIKDYYSGSPDAPAKIRNVEPRFPNGMWQYDYYWDPKFTGNAPLACPTPNPPAGTSLYQYGAAQEEQCGQDGNPETSSHCIGAFQLTLMSGLVLVYASRMHSWSTKNTANDYLSTATDVKGFFYDWFTLPDVKDKTTAKAKEDNLLWNYEVGNRKFIVKERPGTYKDKSFVPGYRYGGPTDEYRVWCGDQGLVLGGLVEYEKANGTTNSNTYIEDLIAGVLDVNGKLFNPSENSSGAIQAFYPQDMNWGCGKLFCLRDYWSGAGVFWRYLFQTYKSNPKVRDAVKAIIAKDGANNVIIQSAKAALEAPQTPWSSEPWGSAGDLFEWFNPLATLTAAIYILEN